MFYNNEQFVSIVDHGKPKSYSQWVIIETRTNTTWLGRLFGYKDYTTEYYGYCTDWYKLPEMTKADWEWLYILWERNRDIKDYEEPTFNDKFIQQLAIGLDKHFKVQRLKARSDNGERRLLVEGRIEITVEDQNHLTIAITDRVNGDTQRLELADPNTSVETITQMIAARI